MEPSSLTEDIHVKTREVSQNTNLDKPEFLGIGKALHSILDSKYYYKTEKILERKLQGSSRLLKRSLMKISLWWSALVPVPWAGNYHSRNTYCSFKIISTIGIAISGIFVGGGEDFAASGSFSPKDERALKKWLVKQASRCPQNTYWKGFWSIACYCWRCCWCHCEFSLQSCWICCMNIRRRIKA